MNTIKQYEFKVKGMTCASCVSRVEKIINKNENFSKTKVDLVSETVNFSAPDDTDLLILASQLNKYGYELAVEKNLYEENITFDDEEKNELKVKKNKLIFASVFTFPILIISMFYKYDFVSQFWFFSDFQTKTILFLLTTPVIFYSGKQFYKSFFRSIFTFNFSMNTLISIGTGSAYIYSSLVTFSSLIF